jgi:predicted nuclease of predicted toxin-antitoxin system
VNFLLDESVPFIVKGILNRKGHNSISLQDLNKRRSKNGVVANIALENDAILITVDSDFLNIKKSLYGRVRIIYVDIHPVGPNEVARVIEKQLDACITALATPGLVLARADGIEIRDTNV